MWACTDYWYTHSHTHTHRVGTYTQIVGIHTNTHTHIYNWYTHTHRDGKDKQQRYKATVGRLFRQHWHTGCAERTKTALAHRLCRKDKDSTGTKAV